MLILLDINVSFKDAFDLQDVKMFIKVGVGGLCARPQSILSTIFFSENVLSVHDLKTFQLIVCLSRTKGATLFAVDVKVITLYIAFINMK